MPAAAPAVLRPEVRPTEPTLVLVADHAPAGLPGHGSRWFAAASMVAGGLAIVAAAGVALSNGGGWLGSVDRPAPASAEASAPQSTAAGSLAITLSGPGDVTVLTQSYEPGKDSGWHAHSGIHAVAVLSGTLKVYDERCQAQIVGPGQSYVGGQEPHLVVNDTAEPVEMVVTYLNPAGPHTSTRHVAPPDGCAPGTGR